MAQEARPSGDPHATVQVEVWNTGSSTGKWARVDVPRAAAQRGVTAALRAAVVRDQGAARWQDVAPEELVAQVYTEPTCAWSPCVVAHRVVVEGPQPPPVEVDAAWLADLDARAQRSPLHLAPMLAVARASLRARPTVPNVAVYDGWFHRTIPRYRRVVPVPAAWRAALELDHVGYHGLSVQWACERAGAAAAARRVVCHLGSGCSVTAVADGRSHWTSMGSSALAGVLMATRPGDLDPQVVVSLAALEARGDLPLPRLHDGLWAHSGLQALAGASDLQQLRARAARGDQPAGDAVARFEESVVQALLAAIGVLGGVDEVVLTGGIGEHDARMRDVVGRAVGLLRSDAASVVVVPCDEARVIAAHAAVAWLAR